MKLEILSNRYKRKAAITILCVMAVVVCYFANLLISEASGLFQLSYDMTDNKLFSISPDSSEYLSNLPDTIKITVTSEQGEFDHYIKKVLDKMDQISNKLSVEYIDTSLHPDLVEKYEKDSKIEKDTIIIANNARFLKFRSIDCYAMDENQNVTGFNAEGKIISTIINVIDYKKKTIKFTNGHNEGGYTELGKLLINNNFNIGKINLNSEELNFDTDLLMIVNPQRDFDAIEINKIDEYTRKGGKIILFKDPRYYNTSRIDQFLKVWGIKSKNNLIVDKTFYYLNNPLYLITKIAKTNDYRRVASMDKIIIAPISQALEMTYNKGISDKSITVEILSSSIKSYSKEKSDFKDLNYKSGDKNGPFSIALLTKNSKYPDSRSVDAAVMVIGSGLFADDKLLTINNFANSDFIIESVFNILGNKAAIGIPVKYFDSGYLNISSNTAKTMGRVFTYIFPSTILFAGIIVWFIRKNR